MLLIQETALTALHARVQNRMIVCPVGPVGHSPQMGVGGYMLVRGNACHAMMCAAVQCVSLCLRVVLIDMMDDGYCY